MQTRWWKSSQTQCFGVPLLITSHNWIVMFCDTNMFYFNLSGWSDI
jgi:hypothetical protein